MKKFISGLIALIILAIIITPNVIGHIVKSRFSKNFGDYAHRVMHMKLENVAYQRGFFHSKLHFELVSEHNIVKNKPLIFQGQFNMTQGPILSYSAHKQNHIELGLLHASGQIKIASHFDHINNLPVLHIALSRPIFGATQGHFRLPVDISTDALENNSQLTIQMVEKGYIRIQNHKVTIKAKSKNILASYKNPKGETTTITVTPLAATANISRVNNNWFVDKTFSIRKIIIKAAGNPHNMVIENIQGKSRNRYGVKTSDINLDVTTQKQSMNGMHLSNIHLSFALNHLHNNLVDAIKNLNHSNDKEQNATNLINALKGTSLSIKPFSFRIMNQYPVSLSLNITLPQKAGELNVPALINITGTKASTFNTMDAGQKRVAGFLQHANASAQFSMPIIYGKMLAAMVANATKIAIDSAVTGNNNTFHGSLIMTLIGSQALKLLTPNGTEATSHIVYDGTNLTINNQPWADVSKLSLDALIGRFLPSDTTTKTLKK